MKTKRIITVIMALVVVALMGCSNSTKAENDTTVTANAAEVVTANQN